MAQAALAIIPQRDLWLDCTGEAICAIARYLGVDPDTRALLHGCEGGHISYFENGMLRSAPSHFMRYERGDPLTGLTITFDDVKEASEGMLTLRSLLLAGEAPILIVRGNHWPMLPPEMGAIHHALVVYGFDDDSERVHFVDNMFMARAALTYQQVSAALADDAMICSVRGTKRDPLSPAQVARVVMDNSRQALCPTGLSNKLQQWCMQRGIDPATVKAGVAGLDEYIEHLRGSEFASASTAAQLLLCSIDLLTHANNRYWQGVVCQQLGKAGFTGFTEASNEFEAVARDWRIASISVTKVSVTGNLAHLTKVATRLAGIRERETALYKRLENVTVPPAANNPHGGYQV